MPRSRLILSTMLAVSVSVAVAFAMGSTDQGGATGGGTGDTGGMGGGAMGGTGDTGGMTGATGGTSGAAGELTPAQKVRLVRSAAIYNQLTQDPDMVVVITQTPYAAYLLTRQQAYKAWATQNKEQARKINEAAQQWKSMSQAEKDQFFQQNPEIQGGGAAGGAGGTGGMGGGSMGGTTDTGGLGGTGSTGGMGGGMGGTTDTSFTGSGSGSMGGY